MRGSLSRRLAIVAISLVTAGCGCAASGERRTEERSVPSADAHEAWGATFVLPNGFSGGENDAGGIELTDGDVAVMIGRSELGEGETLEAFAASRRQALSETGAGKGVEQSEQRIAGERAWLVRARGDDGVRLRLLTTRLGPRSGISFLLIGDAAHEARLEAAFAKLIGSLELPPAPPK